MKKCLNVAFIYTIAALCAGVFYREFTKFNGFTGATALGKVHTHLFLLGMIVFLITALFARSFDIEKSKSFRAFMIVYNAGVTLCAVMMTVRGVLDVIVPELSEGADAAVSGISGIGHILVGTGLVLLMITLGKCADKRRG